MQTEMFPALVALAVATLFTPGPNNAMLAASGATHGYRRTLPHLLGVSLGFPVMLLGVGLALGGLFQTSALLREGLRWGGAAILLWLAWKIAVSAGTGSNSTALRPFTFAQAAGFQWINPKAWTMAIAATSQFISDAAPVLTAAVTAGTFLALGLVSSSTWTLAGQAMTRWLTTATRRRAFNLAMATLIVASTLQMLLG